MILSNNFTKFMKNITRYHDMLTQNNRHIFRLRTSQNEMHDVARKGGDTALKIQTTAT